MPVTVLLIFMLTTYFYFTISIFFSRVWSQQVMAGPAATSLSFFAIAIANRRYGASYAFAQLVIALVLAAATVAFVGGHIGSYLPHPAEPSLRLAVAFAAAFLLSGFVSILMFDGARGPHWWTAPLMGLVVPALVFSGLFFPLAYGGTSDPAWMSHMLACAGVLVCAAIVALVPYWLLRGIVPPLPGYGGF